MTYKRYTLWMGRCSLIKIVNQSYKISEPVCFLRVYLVSMNQSYWVNPTWSVLTRDKTTHYSPSPTTHLATHTSEDKLKGAYRVEKSSKAISEGNLYHSCIRVGVLVDYYLRGRDHIGFLRISILTIRQPKSDKYTNTHQKIYKEQY